MTNLSLRTAALLLALGTCPFNNCTARAAEPAPALQRPVTKRLALWQRAAPLAGARYTLTRKTSLLWDPLVVHGALTLTPDLLELRDDERTGATTKIWRHGAASRCEISANDPSLPPGPAVQASPALTWLQDHLLALLGARDQDALIKDARVSIPRGPGMAFELSPRTSHPAHTTIDGLRVRLDPDTGEIRELELVLTDGDRVTLTLSDPQRPPV